MPTNSYKQIPPSYFGYEGGYDNVTICRVCKRTALYEDAHPVRPCVQCGGKVSEAVGKWIPPVTSGWLMFKKTIEQGYWRIR